MAFENLVVGRVVLHEVFIRRRACARFLRIGPS
ncbi:hypothetical protein ABIA99_006034 [Bradyrhizobium sp. LB12.1]